MQISKEEAKVLISALDVAVKTGGLQTAAQVIQIAVKLNQYANSQDTESKPEGQDVAGESKKPKDGKK